METVISGEPIDVRREQAIRVIKVMLFSASIVPAVVGGSIAYATGIFNVTLFVLATLGLFLGQSAGDYLYYFMTKFHTDQRDSHTKIFAGWRPFFFDGRSSLYAGIGCLLIDLAIGAYFIAQTGWALAWFVALGGLVAIFFTPLMLRGYKEPVIFVTFGPLCVVGMTFALTQSFSTYALGASLPIACFVTVVAYLKGAKYQIQEINGETFVIKLNSKIILGLLIGGYTSLIAGVLFDLFPVISLGALLGLPFAWNILTTIQDNRSPVHEYLWATVRSIVVLVTCGAFLSVGYFLK